MLRAVRLGLVTALLGLGALLVACSSSGGTTSTSTPASTASATPATSSATASPSTPTPAASAATATIASSGAASATPSATASGGATTTVNVTLHEWDVKVDKSTVPAGTVDFQVKNAGTVAHELVVIKTDLAPDKLPVKGAAVDTTKLDVVKTLTQFSAGTTKELQVDLAAGHYVLICNLPGHYQLGMRTGFTVD